MFRIPYLYIPLTQEEVTNFPWAKAGGTRLFKRMKADK